MAPLSVVAPATGAPAACSGVALDQRVFGRCRTPLYHGSSTSDLSFSVSSQKVTIAAGHTVDLTFTLKNNAVAPKAVDLDVPTDTGLPPWVVGLLPLDLPLEPPRLDLECISGSGPVKAMPPSRETVHVQVALLAGGTLTWRRRVDTVRHALVIDRNRLVGYTGSGTPCKSDDTQVAKGAYRVAASSFVLGLSGLTIDVTVR